MLEKIILQTDRGEFVAEELVPDKGTGEFPYAIRYCSRVFVWRGGNEYHECVSCDIPVPQFYSKMAGMP